MCVGVSFSRYAYIVSTVDHKKCRARIWGRRDHKLSSLIQGHRLIIPSQVVDSPGLLEEGRRGSLLGWAGSMTWKWRKGSCIIFTRSLAMKTTFYFFDSVHLIDLLEAQNNTAVFTCNPSRR